MFKWNFKLYEDSFDMYKEHTDTSDDVNDMGEAIEAAGWGCITSNVMH